MQRSRLLLGLVTLLGCSGVPADEEWVGEARSALTCATRGVAIDVTGSTLLVFDITDPATVLSSAPITGLGVNETAHGLDYRESNDTLYLVTTTTGAVSNSVVFTYTLEPTTGAATLVGMTAAPLAGAGDVAGGWDVNPRTSMMAPFDNAARLININDENARFNLGTGALFGNDNDLTPAASTSIIGAAYDRNTGGTGATLWVIDRDNSQLARVGGIAAFPTPNFGVVTDTQPLGFTLSAGADGGFDIAPDGEFYAVLTNNADGVTRLYKGTEFAVVGPIGIGNQLMSSFTVMPERNDVEVCNGADDDCNGEVDDNLGTTTCGVGSCAATVDNCVDGVEQTCTAGEPAGEICNGSDDNCDGIIDEATCVEPGPCQLAGSCDATTSECRYETAPDGSVCDDGNLCTVSDTCSDGSCSLGEPRNCADDNACTADSCDPTTGCKHEPIDGCDDGCDCSTVGAPRRAAPGVALAALASVVALRGRRRRLATTRTR